MNEAEMRRLLAWFIAQCEGDSGTGASYWDEFPEFRRARCLAKSERPELPVEADEAMLSKIREIRANITLLTLGRPIIIRLAAHAMEVAVTEASASVSQTLFEEWLAYWRSRIPEAQAKAKEARGNN